MTAIGDARLAIEVAVAAVEGLEVFTFNTRVIAPGFVLETAPRLTPSSFTNGTAAGITEAVFSGYLVVAADNYAQDQLEAFVELVINAIENARAGVVIEADPGVWQIGTPLPAYLLTVRVTLTA